MQNATQKADYLAFPRAQIDTDTKTGIGAVNQFRLVTVGQNLPKHVEFTAPLTVYEPPSKSVVDEDDLADRADQKLLYKTKTLLVIRDSLVAELANIPRDREAIKRCIEGMLKLRVNFQAFEWKMAPTLAGSTPEAAEELKNTYLTVALRALEGLKSEMQLNGSPQTALTDGATILFKSLEKGLQASIASIDLPPAPEGFAMSMGMDDSLVTYNQPPAQELPQPGQPQPNQTWQPSQPLPQQTPQVGQQEPKYSLPADQPPPQQLLSASRQLPPQAWQPTLPTQSAQPTLPTQSALPTQPTPPTQPSLRQALSLTPLQMAHRALIENKTDLIIMRNKPKGERDDRQIKATEKARKNLKAHYEKLKAASKDTPATTELPADSKLKGKKNNMNNGYNDE
ncbi:hypothetical protein [Hydrogenophaga sp.]|uniref:hypothetical protein n=1 Tax=Hydrogenophaga sp. TaxID=1904254 RepID=UPI002715A40C|nr:hypothetical protein [Hydrogenophaga sp.]MDO9437433.1 hypothetical protein [Hydrogenophaga sp.]